MSAANGDGGTQTLGMPPVVGGIALNMETLPEPLAGDKALAAAAVVGVPTDGERSLDGE